MSGGRFQYINDTLQSELFGWRGGEHPVFDPYEDKVVSELMYDLLNLTHDLDWYLSGDNGEDDYRKSLGEFKVKWLGRGLKQNILDIVDRRLKEVWTECLGMVGTYGVEGGNDTVTSHK